MASITDLREAVAAYRRIMTEGPSERDKHLASVLGTLPDQLHQTRLQMASIHA